MKMKMMNKFTFKFVYKHGTSIESGKLTADCRRVNIMVGKKTRTCPLCKKEGIKYLCSHLRYKHKMMTAEARAPYLKFSRTTIVKNGRTLLPSTIKDDVLNDFYEK